MNKEPEWKSLLKDLGLTFDVEQSFTDILKYIKKLEGERDSAKSTLESWNKDEEILKLKEQIAEMRTSKNKGISFVVSEEELAEINAWQNDHVNKYHGGDSYCGAIGGRFSYKFIPTSIGDIGYVYCDSCKKNHKVKKKERRFCFREL